MADTDPILHNAGLLDDLWEMRLSRRQLMQGTLAVSAGAVLASCGFGSSGVATIKHTNWVWTKAKKAGLLDFANWPLYIDTATDAAGKTTYPSLDQFTQATGIKVNYSEPIQDDPSWFAKIAPSLKAGQPTGYDLMVVTNGIQMTALQANGWLTELDPSKIPNFFKNAAPRLLQRSFDPGNKFTVPWQSGFTGIGYDPTKTGREITSFEDLFDPKFAGKVGMMSGNEDTGNLTLVGMGIQPQKSTPSDWRKAAAKLKAQRDNGIIRKYYDQSYIHALSAGETWISMAWSGDIFQANLSAGNDRLKFVLPKEGGLIWTDNMCIPLHAAHPVDAIDYMNFVYQPTIAAEMASYIDYITPVPAAQALLETQAAQTTDAATKASILQTANSALVFPSKAEFGQVYYYRVLNGTEVTEWNATFDAVILS
jgi:spermidine/putrescine transport system substrate-binding protein